MGFVLFSSWNGECAKGIVAPDGSIRGRNSMHVVVSFTVSESKRLIAKGVAQADFVRGAMEQGTLRLWRPRLFGASRIQGGTYEGT